MRRENYRQRTREIIILLSFLLFPLTYYYFSPYLVIDGASKGIITGSFIVFLLMFLSSLFIGRLFCAWLCPAGGLQRVCYRINNKKFKNAKLDWVKYIIWIPWISIIFFMFFRAGEIISVEPFYQTYYGISISDMYSLMMFLIIVFLIVLISLIFGRRGFCHSICWMAPFMILGRKIRNLGKWPSVRLISRDVNCIDCMVCSKNCPMSIDVNHLVHSSSMEHGECILCGTCVDVCPNNVINYSFSSQR
jgi:polyferredoxin